MNATQNKPTQFIPFDISTLNPLTPQIELAKILGVAPSTLHRYKKLASIFIADFCEQTTARTPLTRYQSWVLIRLNDSFKQLKTTEAITKALKANSREFSLWAFKRATEFNNQ
jgi:hypothetical protein